MKRKKGRKLFSLLLTAALVLSLSGIVALAAESNKQAGDEISEEEAVQNLSFKSSKVSKTTDDAPFTNTLSGAVGTVTYTSSNKSVATVDKNGKVTITGAGTATIKATDAEGSASYTLSVTKPTTSTTTVSTAASDDSKVTDDSDDGENETGKTEGGSGETVKSDDAGDDVEGDSEADDADADIDEADDADADGDADDVDADGDADAYIDEADDADADIDDADDADADIDEADDADADIDEADADSEEDDKTVDAEDEDGGDDAEAVDADGEDSEDEEGVEADDIDGETEDGDEADSFNMDEPLLAEMTGMTVSYYSAAATDKEEQDLSFSAGNTVNKNVNNAPFINPLNGAVGDVEYSSSNESVASVDNDGIVTINGAGTAIITAEVAETSEYKESEASYLAVISDDEQSTGDSASTGDSETKSDTMNIRVALTWEGDTESMRPESVDITLLADGTEKYTTTLTESTGWDHTWNNLPVYADGNVKIEYTVKEIDTPSGYTPSYGDWFNEDNDTYTIIITDTWGVESGVTGTDRPKTSDINFMVLYMYIAVLSGAAIITLNVCRRVPRR